jgi:hypothetical protein
VGTQESEAVALEKALEKLDTLVSEAMALERDPSAPERLAADVEVAEAAKQGLQILRAVQVFAQPASTCMQCLPAYILCSEGRRRSLPAWGHSDLIYAG